MPNMQSRLTVVFLFLTSVVSAQEFRATLQGTIVDPSQAAVPGANITVRDVGTSFERSTTSDSAGHYALPLLPPGAYSVTVRAPGFKTETRDGVQLSVGASVRLDIGMTLGEATESIVVKGSTQEVTPDSSSLESMLARSVIEGLPLKGHGSFFMFTLAPGIVNDKYGQDVRPLDQQGNVHYSSDGAPWATGDALIDGLPIMLDPNRGYYVTAYVPSSEAVGEFKMETGTLKAEYGRTSGGVMNVVIRSGTNEVHGTAYDYFRNSATDANLFYNNLVGQKLPGYASDLFGGSVGFPLIIPKVYNGKDRSFFFASVELLRQGEAASARMNVPTLKMRSGDFSEVNTPIYNPYSVATINGVPTRTPFPNNVIPVSLQDPVGKALMNYWPTPNLFPSVSPWVSDLAQGCKFNTPMEMSTVKFDQNISSKAQLSIRVNKGQGRPVNPCASDPNYPVAGIATTSSYLMVRPNSGFGINYTYIFSPRVVAAFRIGMGRLAELETPFSNGFDIASLGFPSSLANSEQAKAFPIVNFSDGIQSLGYSLFDKYWGDTYSSSNSVTIASGSHMFKAGGDIRVLRGDWWSTQSPTGSFSFAPNQTGGPNASAPSGGFGLASMLLGFGSSGSYGLGTGVSWQGAYYALFFQDDFRVTSKLTLNLGLRWEYDGPRHERYNRTVRGFAYGATSPLSVPALNLRGGLEYAGVNGQPRGLYDSNFRNFSPRIGFAYSLTGKTILRAGYALMYVPITPAMIPLGFTVSTPWITSTDGITVHAPLSNPFPNGQLPLTGNTQGLGTLVGQAVQFAEPSDVIGQYHTWQFNIQRALPSSAVLQVAYVGGRGIRLQSPSVNIDQVPTGMFSMGSGLTATVPNPFYGILPSTSSLGGTTVQEAQLLRPYPQFTGVTRVSPAYGNSHYNSVQVTYQKSLAQGLSGLVTYTISKNIADTNTPQDIYNLQTARGLASFDVPSRMSVALAWNLPFGQKRRFLTNANKATDLVIGGWALSTNEVFQGGMPMSFGVSGGTYFSNTTRPNVVGDPTAGVTGSIDSRLNHYFNTAAFARPTNFTIGNLSANIGTVRTPGMNQVHMTLGKSFQIREKRSVELRITAYNLLNHPMFGSPNTTTGSAAFGVISSQQNLGRQIESMLKIHF